MTLALLAVVGCGEDDVAPPGAAPESELVVPSAKPRVRAKHGERYATDLAASLELSRSDVCNELGRYDCVSDAHRIVVGGVEPYRLGIDEPLPIAPITAPIAYDRIALSACGERADRDFADPGTAALFGDVIPEASVESLRATGTKLYEQVLGRGPDPTELEAIVSFYDEVAAETEAAEAPKEWAVLACFAVATTQEALFY